MTPLPLVLYRPTVAIAIGQPEPLASTLMPHKHSIILPKSFVDRGLIRGRPGRLLSPRLSSLTYISLRSAIVHGIIIETRLPRESTRVLASQDLHQVNHTMLFGPATDVWL